MFNLPMINPENVSRDFIDVFGGYNHNLRIGDNEFYDMKNMSSSCYPLLATRQKRGSVPAFVEHRDNDKIVGAVYRSALYYLTVRIGQSGPMGGTLTLHRVKSGNHEIIKLFDVLDEKPVPSGGVEIRNMIMMGAYMIILPDKLYVNVENPDESGYIEAEFTTQSEITVQACTADGVPIAFDYIGTEPPKNPLDGSIWLDISDTTAVYKKYYASQSSWQSVIANCVLITGEDIDTARFSERDGVKISGFTDEKLKELNNTSIIYKLVDNGMVISTMLDMNSVAGDVELVEYPVKSFTNNPIQKTSETVVYCKSEYNANHFQSISFTNAYIGNNLLVCTSSDAAVVNTDAETSTEYPYTVRIYLRGEIAIGRKDKSLYSLENYSSLNRFTVNDPITFSRKMPDVDYVIESKNRLWGCKYGENSDGDFVNEIYASKLGDFKNWRCYEGISTDSYTASCGTDGEWTGAVNYLGYPVFFKENYIHTVYGSYPAQFQINSVVARGVKNGSNMSIAILNEVLYYMSSEGICTYNGSLPMNISEAFGDERYDHAIACAHNGKYYVMLADENDDNTVLMVYDSKRNIWHKEDDLYVDLFCPVTNDIFYLDEDKSLRALFGTGGTDDTPIEWYAETGQYGLSQIDSKYISRLNIRLSLEVGANAIVSIQYDNSGVWERLCNVVRKNINPFTLPIKPRRCDHFRIRLEGKGGVKVYSISKTLEQGSDR